MIKFATLLISLLVLCQETLATCEGRQYFKNGSCVDCKVCPTNILVLEQCTNTSNTICSKCFTWQRPNAGGDCDFDCTQCRPHGECVGHSHCTCFNDYTGITCNIPPNTPSPTEQAPRDTHPEEEGNRVVLIICIVAASVVALVVVIGIILFYLMCSRRSRHERENSDESTYSSASINSRTMLTDEHNGSLQHSKQQLTNGYRSTILPPPEPWNNNIASAIK